MQNQKKQFIILVILLVVCVGAWLGIRAYNDRAQEKEEKETEAKKITVAEINADDITAFSYESDGAELSFTNTDGTWTYDGDPSIPLDQDAVVSLLSNVEKVTAEDKIEDDPCDDERERICIYVWYEQQPSGAGLSDVRGG